MPLISIQIDLATALRYKKNLKEPDPGQVAVLVDLAGADAVSCHLREDRLYIRDRDIYILKEVIRSKFIVRIAPDNELLERVLEVKPDMVVLMPFLSDKNILNDNERYIAAGKSLYDAGIDVGCSIKPEVDEVKAAARVKAEIVEIDASDYSRVSSRDEIKDELNRLDQIVHLAEKLGMASHCGGGLTYRNIRPVLKLDIFESFTVGHSVLSRGLMVGLDRAVKEMADIIHNVPIIE